MAQRRSRHTTKPINTDEPHIVEAATLHDKEIFDILFWHRFLPTTWIHAHFPGEYSYTRKRCGILKEDQNRYLLWPKELNPGFSNTRHGVYALAQRGAHAIGRSLPPYSKNEYAHEFLVSLHECSLKFQARKEGLAFSFLDETEYVLPSGKTWRPDGHPIVIGDDNVLIHSEIERRHYAESKKKTEEKIEKAHEYVRSRQYGRDARSGVVLFLSSSQGRTDTLMRYTQEHFKTCSFFGFATTEDHANEARYPDPAIPLVSTWERVGYPPLQLMETVHEPYRTTARTS